MSHARRIAPGPGQESVWDYPRPPRLELSEKLVRIKFNGETIAETSRAYRVLETSHPPTYYIPPEDIQAKFLERSSRASFCEWKGRARYHGLKVGDRRAADVAWSYPDPTPNFAAIRDYLAFYPSAPSATRWSTPSRGTSTAAGSPPRSSAHSKAIRGRWGGKPAGAAVLTAPGTRGQSDRRRIRPRGVRPRRGQRHAPAVQVKGFDPIKRRSGRSLRSQG